MHDLSKYYRKLKCLDADKVQIQGDYNSPQARHLVLLFEKCDPEKFTEGKCKSDEAIIEWLRRKFVIIHSNQMRFNSRDYNSLDKISREAKFEYFPVNTILREEIVN